MIAEATIDQIKNITKIQDVVETFVKLKKQSGNLIACCPFHEDRTPSFTVSPVKQIFKCFGCGKSGDAIAFLIEHQKIGYIDAIKWLAEKYNIEVEETRTKDFVKPVARLEKLSAKLIQWFENERKIGNNTLLRFDITESKEWMPQHQKECPVVCFNYRRDGELINIKFRGPQKSFKLSQNAELIFYNLDSIKDSKEAVIVEGEIDCLSMYEAGIYNVVSVPNGAALGNQKLEYLDNCYHYFTDKEKVVIAVDADEAGSRLKEEISRRIGVDKCLFVCYPEGCKDANDVLVKHGKDALKAMVHQASELPISGLVQFNDMEAEADEYYADGYPTGLRAHIPGFDELLNFYPGQLTVITGIPGSGKSEFVDYVMASLTKFHNWSWGVCSFETPPTFHMTKLAEKFTGKAFDFRKNLAHRMDQKDWQYAKRMVKEYYHFINLSMVDVTMDGLLKKAEELVKRKGINGLLFDPWNCIEHKYGEESETKYVLTCLNKLINFLDRYKVHCFLVAHPTKLQKDKKTGKYEIPTLYNISGSAHFFNRTHNGISLWRDFQTNTVDVYVQKVKYSWLGKLGFATFNYNTLTRQYEIFNGGEDVGDVLPAGSWKPVQSEDLFN
jgi:twinkle protein